MGVDTVEWSVRERVVDCAEKIPERGEEKERNFFSPFFLLRCCLLEQAKWMS